MKDLLAREDDEDLPVDDGLGTWASACGLGKDPAPSGFEFDDEMLRAWIAARLRRAEGRCYCARPAARRKQREEIYLESILDDNGEVTPGVAFTCQALAPAGRFPARAPVPGPSAAVPGRRFSRTRSSRVLPEPADVQTGRAEARRRGARQDRRVRRRRAGRPRMPGRTPCRRRGRARPAAPASGRPPAAWRRRTRDRTSWPRGTSSRARRGRARRGRARGVGRRRLSRGGAAATAGRGARRPGARRTRRRSISWALHAPRRGRPTRKHRVAARRRTARRTARPPAACRTARRTPAAPPAASPAAPPAARACRTARRTARRRSVPSRRSVGRHRHLRRSARRCQRGLHVVGSLEGMLQPDEQREAELRSLMLQRLAQRQADARRHGAHREDGETLTIHASLLVSASRAR